MHNQTLWQSWETNILARLDSTNLWGRNGVPRCDLSNISNDNAEPQFVLFCIPPIIKPVIAKTLNDLALGYDVRSRGKQINVGVHIEGLDNSKLKLLGELIEANWEAHKNFLDNSRQSPIASANFR